MFKGIIKRNIIVKSDNIADIEFYTFFRNFDFPFAPQKGMFICFSLHEFTIENVRFIEESYNHNPSLSIDLETLEIPLDYKEALNKQLMMMTKCGFDYSIV